MTPAQLEHLKLIDAHLERLLEIASKRAEYPHKWEHHGRRVAFWWGDECHGGYWLDGPRLDENTAAFIAAAAGNAEAGWRATRAAIALLFAMCDGAHSINTVIAARKMGESILAAFPLEIVKP